MKAKSFFRLAMLAGGLLALMQGQAQVTTPFNTPAGPNDYVGWNGGTTSTIPLMVRHNGNYPIEWYTDSIQRMQLWNSRTGTVNGLTGISQNGYVGISNQPLFFNSAAGPFSRLHLADSSSSNNHLDFAQQYGFRRWMRNGITMTGNKDQCYLGQKYNGTSFPNDSSDLVLQWSDNPADQAWPTDRLRFLFTTGLDPSQAYGAASNEGLESFRVFIPDDTTANVGIGDWWKATVLNGGVAVDPTERLDVLDGRVRIRELPEPAGETTGTFKLMVVDDTPSPSGERGVVKWVDPNDLPGGADCDWVMNAAANKLTTAWQPVNSNGNCPELDWRVGIGTNFPGAKLHVIRTMNGESGAYDGGRFVIDGPTIGSNASFIKVAVKGFSAGSSNHNMGVFGEASASEGVVLTTGVRGHATGLQVTGGTRIGVDGLTKRGGDIAIAVNANAAGAADRVYGVKSHASAAHADSGAYTGKAYGVYTSVGNGAGEQYALYAKEPFTFANDTLPTSSSWAGFFDGKVHITSNAYVNGNVLVTSDAQFKTNVAELQNAREMIAALQPKTYEFIEVDHPGMQLPQGTQMGLLAQELEDVFPNLVGTTRLPTAEDTLGNTIHPGMEYKMVNYTGLIPLLIAGMQEQQAELDSQQEANDALQGEMDELRHRLDQLEQALALCCTTPSDGQQLQTPGDGTEGRMLPDAGSERLLTIAPNPFTEQTTVSYTLERGGRAMLMVHGSDGKHLQILEEGARSEGQYQYVWHTAHLAPGVYYVTLLLDGEPLVKRAVKVR